VSAGFQNITTSLKVLLIASIVVVGLVLPAGADNALNFEPSFFSELSSPVFAVCLIYVTYAYSGWNAAAYITGEFKNVRKALPVALVVGTLVVTLLYTALQYVFMKHAPYDALAGKLDVGTIAAEYMLGDRFAPFFSGAISLLLVSGISAMVWVGPRVTSSIADDHPLWRFFQNNKKGIPVKALWLQAVLSAVLLLTGTFEQILIYCGILLNISALFVIIGVFRLRLKNQYAFAFKRRQGELRLKEKKYSQVQAYKSPLFPLFQFLFILIVCWIIIFSVVNKPLETLVGGLNLLVGLVSYFISKRMRKKSFR
jgi:APA family basic amino acid/polyamine antiporter